MASNDEYQQNVFWNPVVNYVSTIDTELSNLLDVQSNIDSEVDVRILYVEDNILPF